MVKRITAWTLGGLSLWAASVAWAGSNPTVTYPAKAISVFPAKAGKAKAIPLIQASAPKGAPAQGNPEGTSAPQTQAAPAPKPILADAFIAQTILRVYLNRPAAIFVYNSRGQQVYHLDSNGPMEAVPLLGMNTGFIYLTVRTAQGEMTKKLVFTGK